MSLDISLISKTAVMKQGTGVFIRENGQNVELTPEQVAEKFPGSKPAPLHSFETNEVFDWNITHNLNQMAMKAGLYEALWRPDENKMKYAKDVIPALEDGLERLKNNREYFEQFNPENGWGSYDGLLKCVEEYLKAARLYPHAEIEVSR